MESRGFYIGGLIFVASIWGFNFGFSRLGMDTFDARLLIFLRFGLAVPILFLFLWLKEGNIGIHWRDVSGFLFIGFVGITMLEILVMYSIAHTTLANAALLNVAPWPIFAALFSPFFAKEQINSRLLLGGAIAMCGVTLVILGGSEGIDLSSSYMLGNFAALGVSIIGALMNLQSMLLMRQYSALRLTTWQIFIGVICLAPFTWGTWSRVAWSSLGPAEIAIVFYNVIFCTIIAFMLWNLCMQRVGATASNFFRYVVPVAAVWIGFILYGEQIDGWQIIGALCMVAGLVWISFGRDLIKSKK